MKKLLFAAALAVAQSTALCDGKATLEEEWEAKMRHLTISEKCNQESWNRNTATNGVKVLVCTDSSHHSGALIFREFEFDREGRLSSISPVDHSSRSIIQRKITKPLHRESLRTLEERRREREKSKKD